jgi:uncharacterized protein YyaL (SSP411 family)
VGYVSGENRFGEKARRALDTVFDEAMTFPDVSPAAALTAAHLEGHPVQIVLVGPPRNESMLLLRHSGFFLFEPRRVMFTLNPGPDTKRLEKLGYPADADPALYVCVETLCSPPIQDPDKVEVTVKNIKKLSVNVEPQEGR